MKLLGKKALVTGARAGSVAVAALELASAPGADVAINDRERTPQAEAVIADIRRHLGRQAFLGRRRCLRPAVLQKALWPRALGCALRSHRYLHQQSGLFKRRAAFLDYDPDTFGQGAEGNALRRLPHEPACGSAHGRALVAEARSSSSAPFILSFPMRAVVAYNAAKSGLKQMCALTIAAELMPHRINVNLIDPGWIDTPGEHEDVR